MLWMCQLIDCISSLLNIAVLLQVAVGFSPFHHSTESNLPRLKLQNRFEFDSWLLSGVHSRCLWTQQEELKKKKSLLAAASPSPCERLAGKVSSLCELRLIAYWNEWKPAAQSGRTYGFRRRSAISMHGMWLLGCNLQSHKRDPFHFLLSWCSWAACLAETRATEPIRGLRLGATSSRTQWTSWSCSSTKPN